MAAIPEATRATATMESLRPLLEFVASCAERRGFGETRIRQIELALEEILVNIVHYAYPERPGEVGITCRGDEAARLVVEIADGGIPFDPLAAVDPDLEAGIDEREVGGLGIFFVKRLMGDVRYRREAGMNILTLTVDPAPVGG